jgi:hypothetical protein
MIAIYKQRNRIADRVNNNNNNNINENEELENVDSSKQSRNVG